MVNFAASLGGQGWKGKLMITIRELALSGAALLAAAGLGSAPASAALVVNGDFETGDFTGWTQSGDTSFDSVIDSSNGPIYDGTYSASLGSIAGSTLSQVLDVVAGQSYTLTFALANLDELADNAFSVALGNSTFTLPDNFIPFDYGTFSVSTIADSATLDLAFSAINGPSYWLLDNVTVKQDAVPVVPEPETWALLLVGFGVVGASLRRRQRVEAFS